MVHAITQYDGALTVRLDGRVNAAELTQDMKAQLETHTSGPVVVVIDLSLARSLGQPVKAALYRLLQHSRVLKIGFCGMTQEMMAELNDLLPLLQRVRPVVVAVTEAEVRQQLGLSQPNTERKLTGMLSYLKKASQEA